MTIDDVVTKTGITLGVLTISALVSYFLVNNNVDLATPLVIGGGLVVGDVVELGQFELLQTLDDGVQRDGDGEGR